MSETGKLLMLLGALLLLAGAVLWGLGRTGFRGLPGDIVYQGKNVRIYFPIVSMILLSVVLTLLIWIWQWISRR